MSSSERDDSTMIINYGRQILTDIFCTNVGPVNKLRHCNGLNFATIFIIPQIIEGKTHLAIVGNTDNNKNQVIKKLPGGCSEKNETIQETIVRECVEETGFTPTEVTFIDYKKVASNEKKEKDHDGDTHFKIILWVNKKTGSARTKNMVDEENETFDFIPIKEITNDTKFNIGHRHFLNDWVKFLSFLKQDHLIAW